MLVARATLRVMLSALVLSAVMVKSARNLKAVMMEMKMNVVPVMRVAMGPA